MLKRIALVALIIIAVWFAASSDLTANLRPYVEKGTELLWELAGSAKRHLEDLREKREVLGPEGEKSLPEETIGVTKDPLEVPIGEGGVNDKFLERDKTSLEEKGSYTLDAQGEVDEHKQKKSGQVDVFPDLYEQAKNSLLRSMRILEGRDNGPQ